MLARQGSSRLPCGSDTPTVPSTRWSTGSSTRRFATASETLCSGVVTCADDRGITLTRRNMSEANPVIIIHAPPSPVPIPPDQSISQPVSRYFSSGFSTHKVVYSNANNTSVAGTETFSVGTETSRRMMLGSALQCSIRGVRRLSQLATYPQKISGDVYPTFSGLLSLPPPLYFCHPASVHTGVMLYKCSSVLLKGCLRSRMFERAIVWTKGGGRMSCLSVSKNDFRSFAFDPFPSVYSNSLPQCFKINLILSCLQSSVVEISRHYITLHYKNLVSTLQISTLQLSAVQYQQKVL